MGGGIRMFVRVDAPPARVYAVLADVGRYPAWMPGVKAVEVVETETAGALRVGFVVEGPFGDVTYVLRRHHRPPRDGRTGRIWWDLAAGEFREMRGAYEIAPDGDGGTLLSYRSVVRPLRWVPQSLVRGFARREVRRVAEAIRARSAARPAASNQP